jgi:hypothetical protein
MWHHALIALSAGLLSNDFAFLLRSKMEGASEAREDDARRDSSKR